MKKKHHVTITLLMVMALLLTAFSASAYAFSAEYTIDDKGGDCASIGIWNSSSKTCTLTADVLASGTDDYMITITGSDIVLEGNGHTLTVVRGIYEWITDVGIMNIQQATGCTVRNLIFADQDAVYLGIDIVSSNSNTIENITIQGNRTYGAWRAMNLFGSDSNTIRNINGSYVWYPVMLSESHENLFENNVFVNASRGIDFYMDSSFNTFSNNTIHAIGPSVYFADTSAIHDNEFSLNSFVESNVAIDAPLSADNLYYNNEFITNSIGWEWQDLSQDQFYLPLPTYP